MGEIIKLISDALLPIVDGLINLIRNFFRLIGISRNPQADPNSRERIIRGWITLLLFLLIAIVLVRYGFVDLYILQTKVGVLQQLNQISNEGVTSKSELEPIYNELVSQLSKGKVNFMNLINFSIVVSNLTSLLSSPLFWSKFLSGATLGLLLIFWTLASRREKKWKAFLGALIVTVAFGTIGVMFSAKFSNLIINALVLTGIQVLILSYIGRRRILARTPQTT